MRPCITITLALIAAAALASCSSFHMGGACYVPYGVAGSCQVTTLVPADAR